MTTLLVFGDSLSFQGPDGPCPSDDERLWPNRAATMLGGHAELFARSGWTARDAFWTLAGDPRVWTQLPKVDVLVLAVGSMDTLPSPLPTYLREGLRYLRPDPFRRWVRDRYVAAQPWLAKGTRGRPVALPPALTVHYLDRILGSIRMLRPDLPTVGVVPSVHVAGSYGYVHTGHLAAATAVRAWGERTGVPLLDLPALVGDHVFGGRANPDGMHWGWEAHELVGKALADEAGALLRRPG
ncbi:diglucosylglycerate octanoyltransferase [Actinophytocola oryzae]|uniref:GDSL-like lipase/acylhydrolase family protein n=1 Tax=Actinophytocola oryzae TaxID=502181 RepID=A0A4R7USE2_9PSEU|nr:diglucosylglycerate octanoyltransferase [Actinophytocola oryzae]TDV38688.1 GDSL-like lipase/acylhydrolase family protein [Actinophytocola oryzae]